MNTDESGKKNKRMSCGVTLLFHEYFVCCFLILTSQTSNEYGIVALLKYKNKYTESRPGIFHNIANFAGKAIL